MTKFMQTVDNEIFRKLTQIAKERGIIVQELIRAVIIPEWLKATHAPSKPATPKLSPPHSPTGNNGRLQGFIKSIPPPTKKSEQKGKEGIRHE